MTVAVAPAVAVSAVVASAAAASEAAGKVEAAEAWAVGEMVWAAAALVAVA